MTDKLVEQIKADRKAGTPGEWIATKFCEVNDPDPAQSHVSFKVTPQRGVYGSVSESDARRIARVPDMEARILADAGEIRLLEEGLTTSYYNGIRDERARNAKVIEAAKELAVSAHGTIHDDADTSLVEALAAELIEMNAAKECEE